MIPINPLWVYTAFVLTVLAVSVAFVSCRRRLGAVARRVRDQLAERERLIVELEAKNAELERFNYTVSHDLKGPLVTIKGFLGLLEKDALAGDVERMKSDIQRIANAADSMYRLLNELLEFSRTGFLSASEQEVGLTELAREAVGLINRTVSGREVEIEIGDDLPVASGDRTQLLEVFQNLLQNAVKYMGDQEAPRIEVGVRRQEDGDVVFVRDNGIGVRARYHDKIFGMFERLSLEQEGTGIGLALVKRIVELHGGRIWIESQGLGHGSTFCFTLGRRS